MSLWLSTKGGEVVRPSAERAIMIAIACFVLTIIISFALSEGWIK
ncbi:hypothetical protein [Limosilactobacillus reuteri]|nr:hypothetical protein [Limosilactobacillus reuteri]